MPHNSCIKIRAEARTRCSGERGIRILRTILALGEELTIHSPQHQQPSDAISPAATQQAKGAHWLP